MNKSIKIYPAKISNPPHPMIESDFDMADVNGEAYISHALTVLLTKTDFDDLYFEAKQQDAVFVTTESIPTRVFFSFAWVHPKIKNKEFLYAISNGVPKSKRRIQYEFD